MKIDPNDPKWTAYAIGEIRDAREKAELETILDQSPEARLLVEEIREAGAMLRRELQSEPVSGLTLDQKKQIEQRAESTRGFFGIRPAWLLAGTAAAVLMITAVAVRQFKHVQAPPVRLMVETPSVAAPVQEQKKAETAIAAIASKTPKVISRQRSSQHVAGASSSAAPLASLQQKLEVIPGNPSILDTSAVQNFIPSPAVQSPVPGPVSSGGMGMGFGAGRGVGSGISGGVPGGVVGGMLTSAFPVASPPPAPLPARAVRTPWYPRPRPWPRPFWRQPSNTESYDTISDNPFLDVSQNPLSTFSIDVDTASYANMRRFLETGKLPPKDSVRIEELVNYFDYDYAGPKDNKPFAVNFELAEAPWNKQHQLLRIGLKGREVQAAKRLPCNLVFLLDVSGSMQDYNKLPLVQEAMRMLVDRLSEEDRVAIVVYATTSRLELRSTSGYQKEQIKSAIDQLQAGGSTNGASGIQLAYETAQEQFMKGGVNRVILATDGDFNVGVTDRSELTRMIEEKAKSGIYLNALGFGMGNLKDGTLEALAKYGHGNYAYIDTPTEAKKVLVEQINSTLVPIAKDVKVQVEFNPKHVSAYRLIGYEDRVMAKEDFNDDLKEAGVIGAGHAVTALYELVPAGVSGSTTSVDPLKYQKPMQPAAGSNSDELLTVKIRSKDPEGDRSVLSEFAVKESKETKKLFADTSRDFKFAAAVAAFGMVLRDSPHKGNATLVRALDWAQDGQGPDKYGYRGEFIRLVHRAMGLSF